MAAEILDRHNEHGMTQMKLQKLIHLIEYHARLDEIQGEYQRQAESWHETKEDIDPDKWPKALKWMRNHNLVPTGYGKPTRKLK